MLEARKNLHTEYAKTLETADSITSSVFAVQTSRMSSDFFANLEPGQDSPILPRLSLGAGELEPVSIATNRFEDYKIIAGCATKFPRPISEKGLAVFDLSPLSNLLFVYAAVGFRTIKPQACGGGCEARR